MKYSGTIKDFPLTWNGDRLEIENIGFRSNNSYPTDKNNDPRRVFKLTLDSALDGASDAALDLKT